MTNSLNFHVEHSYSAADGISVIVTLRHGQDKVSFDADIDTGSTFCIFNRGHAETLGLNVEFGNPTRFKTVTGSFDAYGHMLTLETLGYWSMSQSFLRHTNPSPATCSAGVAGWINCGLASLIMKAKSI